MSMPPPFQAPFPGYMPSMPPIPDDIVKIIKEHVDKRLDDVMEGKDDKYREKFKHYVHEMMSSVDSSHHHEDEDFYSEIECLHNKIHCLQKMANEGKSMFELEKELHDDLKDLSHEEKRVFSALVRADGPLSLSSMIGISCEDFMKHMKCLGKKIHEHHKKHDKK